MNNEKIHHVEGNIEHCPICGGETICIPSGQEGKTICFCKDSLLKFITTSNSEDHFDRSFFSTKEREDRYYLCAMELQRQKQGSVIRVWGTDANEVQSVSLSLIEKTKEPHNTSLNPWVSGSFYFVVFLVVLVALAVIGRLLPIIVLPLILIGGILAMSVIGALQLRQDERLDEENFLKLMALSFKYLPWIRKRDTANTR